MTEIAAAARRLKRQASLGLVVIDYLQLIEPDNPRDPRQEQVAKIARRLKGLARELKVPVLCLAQLNRQAEVTRDNEPRLSHLRESGAIEQDADVVMFVHREEYYSTNEEERAKVAGQADLIIAKQRNGPTGDVKLAWLKDFTRFRDSAAASLRRIRAIQRRRQVLARVSCQLFPSPRSLSRLSVEGLPLAGNSRRLLHVLAKFDVRAVSMRRTPCGLALVGCYRRRGGWPTSPCWSRPGGGGIELTLSWRLGLGISTPPFRGR